MTGEELRSERTRCMANFVRAVNLAREQITSAELCGIAGNYLKAESNLMAASAGCTKAMGELLWCKGFDCVEKNFPCAYWENK